MNKIEGVLELQVRDLHGSIIDARRVSNTVFQTGALLVGRLFVGQSASVVNGMGVGTNPHPSSAPYETVTLDTNDDAGQPLTGPVVAALVPEDIIVEADPDEMRIRVAIRSVLPADGAQTADGEPVDIAEAALGVLSGDLSTLDVIYNRVSFEPVPKRHDHELALYWEIFFPYGP